MRTYIYTLRNFDQKFWQHIFKNKKKTKQNVYTYFSLKSLRLLKTKSIKFENLKQLDVQFNY